MRPMKSAPDDLKTAAVPLVVPNVRPSPPQAVVVGDYRANESSAGGGSI